VEEGPTLSGLGCCCPVSLICGSEGGGWGAWDHPRAGPGSEWRGSGNEGGMAGMHDHCPSMAGIMPRRRMTTV
jgi:hypothetical protein